MSDYTRYQHLALERAKAVPTREELDALENALGAQLPPEFVEYLMVANGGYLEYQIAISLPKKTEILSFCTLYCTRKEPQTYSFINELYVHRKNLNIPDKILPFAQDGGGSTVYLDLTQEGHSRIIAFIIGLPEWASPNNKSHLVTIANSFSHYVDQLYINREDALEQSQKLKEAHHKEAMRDWLDIGLPQWRDDPEFQVALR